MAQHAGQCTCGAVRYRLLTDPMFVQACHCTWCQRETGSSFVINGQIEALNIALDQGMPRAIRLPSASGRGQIVARYPDCGVALWSTYSSPKKRFIRVATLNDPGLCPPKALIYTASKPNWLSLTPGIPAFEAYYRASELWPAETIARQAALDADERTIDLP